MKTIPWLVMLLCVGCGTLEVRKSSSAVDYLFPEGAPASAPRDVTLRLPVRVGIAFAPGGESSRHDALSQFSDEGTALSEVDRQRILKQVAEAVTQLDEVETAQTIPGQYLHEGGSFDELDQLAHTFGIDLIVLLSYDQLQFSHTNGWSLTYMTLVGAWFVEGEDNQTQTFVEAMVYDIPSRTLLFRASGSSQLGGSATPLDTLPELLRDATAGLAKSTEDLLANLGDALTAFEKQISSGTVRGPGTAAIEVMERNAQ